MKGLKRGRKGTNEELLHDTRVSIKKLKALWILHPLSVEEPFKKRFPCLRRVFRKCGMPRDMQVIKGCLKTLEIWDHQKKAGQLINRQEKQKVKEIEAILASASLAKHAKAEIADMLEQLKTLKSWVIGRHYKRTRILKLAEVDGLQYSQENLHDVRKIIKLLKFQADALYMGQMDLPFEEQQHKLDQLQNQLGTWHDWFTAQCWISANKQKLPPTEYALLFQQASLNLKELEEELIYGLKGISKNP